MGIMVYSLLWVTQDFVHQPYVILIFMDDMCSGLEPSLDPLSSLDARQLHVSTGSCTATRCGHARDEHYWQLLAALKATTDTTANYFDTDTSAHKSLKGREKYMFLDPKGLCPLAVGSAAAKFYSRLLLTRTLPALQLRRPEPNLQTTKQARSNPTPAQPAPRKTLTKTRDVKNGNSKHLKTSKLRVL